MGGWLVGVVKCTDVGVLEWGVVMGGEMVMVVWMEWLEPLAMLEGTLSVEVSLGIGEAMEPFMSSNLFDDAKKEKGKDG